MDQFQAEIDLLQMRAKTNEEKYETTDFEMEQLIKSKAHGNIEKHLIKLWNAECKQQEEISLQRWSKNQMWLEKYKKEFLENNKDLNPFVKKLQRNTQERPIYKRNTEIQHNQIRNFRPKQVQNRYENNYSYNMNVRPQIPFKENYDRRNFSNWQIYRRNQEALDNFQATQARFLDQRRPFRPQR